MTDKPKYPEMAGWKGDKRTGREAAFAVSKDLPRRHGQVLAAFEPHGASGATCDEVSAQLELPVHIVRPRASELERLGKLFPIGRRMGQLGFKVTVYSVVNPEPVAVAA